MPIDDSLTEFHHIRVAPRFPCARRCCAPTSAPGSPHRCGHALRRSCGSQPDRRKSRHPPALAIGTAAETRGLAAPSVTGFGSPTGNGTPGGVDGKRLVPGNAAFLQENGIDAQGLTAMCLIPRFDDAIHSLEWTYAPSWQRHDHPCCPGSNTSRSQIADLSAIGSGADLRARASEPGAARPSQDRGPRTLAKWGKRATVKDMKTGPAKPGSTVPTETEEAMGIAFRHHTLLPLDDCLHALQPSIPHLTRSALHRCPAHGMVAHACLI